MKTPPVQQKQVSDAQKSSGNIASEGKSVSPPAFQLKTSGTAPANPAPVQRAAQIYTINNDIAYLRGGPPDFKSKGKAIPKGTAVEILEEQVAEKGTYYRVKNVDTGAELGWTSKGNLTDLDDHYKNAGSNFVYRVGGRDILVFIPKGGLKKSNPDIFMFFHGRGGDYATAKTHTPGTDEYEDNPAISGKMAEAVSRTGGIAICPQGHGFKVDKDWGKIGEGGYKAMVDTTLQNLTADLGMEKSPLTAGNISLAGHSAGGNAVGQAAQDTGATDVTLQEAGYEFENSWEKLRDWFLTGQAPKTMRVITQNNGGRHATRTLLRDSKKEGDKTIPAGKFKASQIVAYSKTLVKAGLLAGPVKVEEFNGDGKVESGNIVMERGYRVFRSDGSLQGSLRLYHLEDAKADHWAAASQTMETSMTSGAADRAADKAALKK